MVIYLSAADAARRVGVTPAAIRYMERAGSLRAIAKTVGGMRLFSSRDVQALRRRRAIAQRTKRAAA